MKLFTATYALWQGSLEIMTQQMRAMDYEHALMKWDDSNDDGYVLLTLKRTTDHRGRAVVDA